MRSLLIFGALIGSIIVATPDHAQAASLTFPPRPSASHYLSVVDREVTVTSEEVSGQHVVLMHADPERTSPVLARLNVGQKLTTDGEVRGQWTRVFKGNTMGWVITKFVQ